MDERGKALQLEEEAKKARVESDRLWKVLQAETKVSVEGQAALVKALVWFWLIDETLSANLVYQSDYEIGSTTPSDEAMMKIMMMVTAW